MKLKHITLAVAGALAAQAAFALSPADTAAAVSAGRYILASGASAPTASVYKGVRSLCQAGTIDVYITKTITAGGKDPGSIKDAAGKSEENFGYSCTLQAGLTDPDGDAIPWSGQNAVFFHTVKDGSFKSVEGMSSAATFQVEFNNATNCSASGFNTASGDPIQMNCGKAKQRSHGGFSDVEAPIFQDLLTGIPGVDPSDVQIIPANAGQVFGLAVSNSLYRAMQTAQSLPASCQDGGADDYAAACQPSITKQQYASIAAASGGYHADWQFLLGTAGANKVVNLFRRVDTSGTQASSNVFFLANPCARGSQTFGQLAPATAANSSTTNPADPAGGFNVVEYSSSGTLKADLSAFSNFAIGVLSAENKPETTGGWQFVKIDGVSPNEDSKNRVSAIQGRYDFAMELVLHLNADTAITPAVPAQVLKKVAFNLGDPNSTDLTGVFVSPLGGYANADYPTQVHKGTRFGNSCSPFQLF